MEPRSLKRRKLLGEIRAGNAEGTYDGGGTIKDDADGGGSSGDHEECNGNSSENENENENNNINGNDNVNDVDNGKAAKVASPPTAIGCVARRESVLCGGDGGISGSTSSTSSQDAAVVPAAIGGSASSIAAPIDPASSTVSSPPEEEGTKGKKKLKNISFDALSTSHYIKPLLSLLPLPPSQKFFREAGSHGSYRYDLSSVAACKGMVVGVCLVGEKVYPADGEGREEVCYYVYYIAVEPGVRDRGVGKGLMEDCVGKVRRNANGGGAQGQREGKEEDPPSPLPHTQKKKSSIRTHCTLESVPFYEKCGFRKISVEKGYYGRIGDATFMEKII